MSNGYRTLSQHLNDLKKENFSLKLRIYFLEERIQQKYEESSEDVYRSVSTSCVVLRFYLITFFPLRTTAENLTNQNEAELQRRCQDRQQEIDHMQQVLETKIQLLQEEALLARSQAQHMAAVAGSPSSDISMETMEDQSLLSPSPSNTNINRDKYVTFSTSCSSKRWGCYPNIPSYLLSYPLFLYPQKCLSGGHDKQF
uniref:Centrosomin N-terminal motif 1 domain-containing protein n=1 Tax=Gouania willdenowi TaxID=441366 RepID=A0A8C5GBU8_GOUWI